MAEDPAIDTFYREWRRSLRAAVAEYGLRPRMLVDLAGGTGNSTVPWTRRRGLRVVGARGRLYRRMEVTVRERAYEDREVRRMLRHAGMNLVGVRVQRTVAGRPGRKVYLARAGRGQTSQIRKASSRARRGSSVGTNSWARKPA